MRSTLARNVTRRLQPRVLPVQRCHGQRPSCSVFPRQCSRRASVLFNGSVTRKESRRTFFGIFGKPPREVKEPDLDPGYATLLEFNSSESDNVRPPKRDELLKAFRDLFSYKVSHNTAVNATQALCALRALQYLLSAPAEEQGLALQDLRTARDALLIGSKKSLSESHLELSKALYLEVKRVVSNASELGESDKPRAGEAGFEDFKLYLTALTQFGAAVEAADLLQPYWTQLQMEGDVYDGADSLWVLVLRGLAREGNEQELLKQLGHAEGAGVEYTPHMHEVMTTFFADRDNFDETRTWFTKHIHRDLPATAEAYAAVLAMAVRNKNLDWANQIFEQLCNTNPEKPWWDVIFQWAVLAQGKGDEDVKTMIEAMIRLNPDREAARPDIETINGLVRAAIQKKDPLLGERFVLLATSLGLQPNHVTFVLQMENRLAARDFSGTAAAYRLVEGSGVIDEPVLAVLNRYTQALCAVEKPDANRILDVVAAVERKQAFLEPETVAAICMMFLKADQHFDVIDTLSLHTLHYSLQERAVVQQAFIQYCLDRKNSTSRAWDAYSLLRQFFPDTGLDDRVLLLQAFFDRKRPDMACHVFGHMRSHANPSMRPTANVYAQCLQGLGRQPDAESLRIVHNMLKMDTTIDMTIQIYNGLMMAYAAADQPQTAADFWKDITQSAEGPNYNSLNIIFRVCESLPFGDDRARMIWQKLQKMEVDVPPFVFASYCGALASHSHVEEVKALIQGQNAQLGHAPGWLTLGIVYNALPAQEQRDDFEAWAKASYPQLWEELRKKRRRKTVEGLDRFDLVRDLWVR